MFRGIPSCQSPPAPSLPPHAPGRVNRPEAHILSMARVITNIYVSFLGQADWIALEGTHRDFNFLRIQNFLLFLQERKKELENRTARENQIAELLMDGESLQNRLVYSSPKMQCTLVNSQGILWRYVGDYVLILPNAREFESAEMEIAESKPLNELRLVHKHSKQELVKQIVPGQMIFQCYVIQTPEPTLWFVVRSGREPIPIVKSITLEKLVELEGYLDLYACDVVSFLANHEILKNGCAQFLTNVQIIVSNERFLVIGDTNVTTIFDATDPNFSFTIPIKNVHHLYLYDQLLLCLSADTLAIYYYVNGTFRQYCSFQIDLKKDGYCFKSAEIIDDQIYIVHGEDPDVGPRKEAEIRNYYGFKDRALLVGSIYDLKTKKLTPIYNHYCQGLWEIQRFVKHNQKLFGISRYLSTWRDLAELPRNRELFSGVGYHTLRPLGDYLMVSTLGGSTILDKEGRSREFHEKFFPSFQWNKNHVHTLDLPPDDTLLVITSEEEDSLRDATHQLHLYDVSSTVVSLIGV